MIPSPFGARVTSASAIAQAITTRRAHRPETTTRWIIARLITRKRRLLLSCYRQAFTIGRKSIMRTLRKLSALATVAVIATAALMPTSAEARNGRIAAGVVGGFAAGVLAGAAMGGPYWGPYPYYPAPVYYPPGPYYALYGPVYYGPCVRRTVWDGWRWRRVRVCY